MGFEGSVCAWVFWVHECVGAVGQILAWMM